MRPQDWDKQLYNYVLAARERPFQWGTWDCCTFVLQWVTLMTGVDHTSKFPPYTTEEEALGIVDSMGGWERMVAEQIGAPKLPSWKMAKRGDVVLAREPWGLGLVIDQRLCRPRPPVGLSFEEIRLKAVMGWSV